MTLIAGITAGAVITACLALAARWLTQPADERRTS
jgi:hypothetical protein